MRWLIKVVAAGLWGCVTPVLAMLAYSGIEPGMAPDSNEVALIIGLGTIMVFLPACLFTALIGIPIAAWLEGAGARAATHLLVCAGAFGALGFVWVLWPLDNQPTTVDGTRNLQEQLLAFTLMGANLGLAWSVLNLWHPPLPDREFPDG